MSFFDTSFFLHLLVQCAVIIPIAICFYRWGVRSALTHKSIIMSELEREKEFYRLELQKLSQTHIELVYKYYGLSQDAARQQAQK